MMGDAIKRLLEQEDKPPDGWWFSPPKRKSGDTMKFIRNLRGSWPNWLADLNGGGFVYCRIRRGDAFIGVGSTPYEAYFNADRVAHGEAAYAGVSDDVDALVLLKRHGYYFCFPREMEIQEEAKCA